MLLTALYARLRQLLCTSSTLRHRRCLSAAAACCRDLHVILRLRKVRCRQLPFSRPLKCGAVQMSPCLLRPVMHARFASRAGSAGWWAVEGGMAYAVRARMRILARMAAELRKQAEENFGGSIQAIHSTCYYLIAERLTTRPPAKAKELISHLSRSA
ncbi:uncharacterized protein CC84DRAFT_42614 [Paraphaeosphaeria sporulosa]|uniref:Uncharacterized protein n=1 Tax=Paraphaeosphaeria sporulosa TaxID=1460663 RepID=A0A177CXS2_9PLEO|nr:uncharacterized protein CC84DRAFT_42614 [Paraphaeosphaeria sporulosa]OAG11692.1 hypothetical protein CC84DRAFT_42614 [Paraphaeosphaeria sporulosa]